MNTVACGTALQKYGAVLYSISGTNDFQVVIYSQNKMIWDSFSITGMRH